jgi:hypothetical protein
MAYTTPLKIQYEIRATDSFSTDTEPTLDTINSWITEVDQYIDTLANRSFGLTLREENCDYNGNQYLVLKHSPVDSMVSVQYATYPIGSTNYPTYAALSEDSEYTVYNDQGRIAWNYNVFSPSEGRKRFLVSYYSGSSDIPSDIQMLSTKMVAQRVLNSLINSNVNTTNDGGSVSVGSISIVEPASYGVNSYVKLGEDIQRLQEVIIGKFRVHRYNGGQI